MVLELACGNSRCNMGTMITEVWLAENMSVEAQEITMAHAIAGSHGRNWFQRSTIQLGSSVLRV
jgi:hypothetical protein